MHKRWLIFIIVWVSSTLLFLNLASTWFYIAVGAMLLLAVALRLRPHMALICTLVAVGLFMQSAHLLDDEKHLASAAIYFLLGGLVLGIAVNGLWRDFTFPSPHNTHLAPGRSRWTMAALGMLMLVALAEANGNLLGIEQLEDRNHLTQLTLLCAGVGMLVLGLSGGGLRRPQIPFTEALVVIAITAFGLVLRTWHLETLVHKFIDELNFATYSIFFRTRDDIQLLRPEVRGFPTIFTFFQAKTIELFGTNLAGVRMVSAVMGTMTIPALYLLARSLFDRQVAVLAAILLTSFPPHIHFSRLALNNIADPLFGTAALAFIALGLRTGRRLDFALGGAMLGFTQYFYEGGRLLYPPLMLAWLGLGLLMWYPRPQFKGLLIAACAATAVAVPIYYTLYARDLPLTTRLDAEALNGDYWREVPQETDDYLEHLKYSMLSYTTQPEWVAYYYGGEVGLVLDYLLPAAFLGIFFIWWRFYTPSSLLLLWLAATIFGTSLLRHNVLSTRHVVVFPALTLLMAVGLRYTSHLIWAERRYASLAMGFVIVLFAIGQVNYYFDEHLDLFNYQTRKQWHYDGEDAIFRSVDFAPHTRIYIITDQAIDEHYGNKMLAYLSDKNLFVEIIHPQDLDHERMARMPNNVDNAFFIDRHDQRTLQLLETYFFLEGPSFSPYEVLEWKELALYYARAFSPING